MSFQQLVHRISNRIQQPLNMITDTRFRNYHLQRQVLAPTTREQNARKLAPSLPQTSLAEPAETKLLAAQGFAMLPDLTPQQTAEMAAYFSDKMCTDEYRPHHGYFQAKDAPADTHVAIFDHDVVAAAPHALTIANDPRMVDAVAPALGVKPTIAVMSAWWSFPHGDARGEQAQLWHRDMDDWRFVKSFHYLTDVDDDAGPHVYLPGSHKRDVLMKIRRYEDAELAEAFPDLKPHRFTGAAGTSFLENTFGFHRGYPPRHAPRLIYSVTYSMRPLVHGPKTPVATLPDGFDPYMNRVYYS